MTDEAAVVPLAPGGDFAGAVAAVRALAERNRWVARAGVRRGVVLGVLGGDAGLGIEESVRWLRVVDGRVEASVAVVPLLACGCGGVGSLVEAVDRVDGSCLLRWRRAGGSAGDQVFVPGRGELRRQVRERALRWLLAGVFEEVLERFDVRWSGSVGRRWLALGTGMGEWSEGWAAGDGWDGVAAAGRRCWSGGRVQRPAAAMYARLDALSGALGRCGLGGRVVPGGLSAVEAVLLGMRWSKELAAAEGAGSAVEEHEAG